MAHGRVCVVLAAVSAERTHHVDTRTGQMLSLLVPFGNALEVGATEA